MDSVNIGFFSEMANIEGSAYHMVRQMRWMLRNGHKVVMFSSGGLLEPLLAEIGVPHVPIASAKPGINFQVEQIAEDAFALLDAVERFDLQAIITSPQWPFALASASVGKRIPVFLQILSPVYHVPNTAITVEYLRAAVADGRVLAHVFDDVKPHAKAFGFDANQVRIQNIPIDASSTEVINGRDAMREELGVAGDEIMVFSACRLDADRFPFIQPMAEGIAQLRRMGKRVRLFVAGDGTHAQILRQNAPEGTTYIGVRRDLPDLYAAADIYCGEGATIVEAARAGLPVVMTCALTQPQRAAFAYAILGLHFVDRIFWESNALNPPTGFADALLPLIDDAALRRRLSEAAQLSAERYWNIDVYMPWLLETLAGKATPSMVPERAQTVITLADDGDALERIGAALSAHGDRLSNVAVQSQAPVDWNRLLKIPLEDAQRLSRASRLLVDRDTIGAKVRGHVYEGELPSELAALFEHARTDQTMFGAPREHVHLIVAERIDGTWLSGLMSSLPAGAAVVCLAMTPEASADARALLPGIRPNEISSFAIDGPITAPLLEELFRSVGAYYDRGEAAFETYRDLANRVGLPIGHEAEVQA